VFEVVRDVGVNPGLRIVAGDADFSRRWRLIKSRFSRAVGLKQPRNASQVAKNERDLWQRRFREHCIRDDADLAAHLAYCWANPVKHGLVTRAVDWPYSSFHRDIRRGLAGDEWAG
jgi:putative transposase